MRESCLVALRAPGSIESSVCGLQEEIFAAHGLVSAIALPPLVPVAFIAGMPRGGRGQGTPRAFLERLEAAVRAPYRISPRGAAWVDGALFALVDTGGEWEALSAACAADDAGAPPARAALFPVVEGFFLGCVEAGAAARRGIAAETSFPSFTSATLALVRIETPARGKRWWRDVTCSIEEEKPLRGRKR
jgi:hypothetical protein